MSHTCTLAELSFVQHGVGAILGVEGSLSRGDSTASNFTYTALSEVRVLRLVTRFACLLFLRPADSSIFPAAAMQLRWCVGPTQIYCWGFASLQTHACREHRSSGSWACRPSGSRHAHVNSARQLDFNLFSLHRVRCFELAHQ